MKQFALLATIGLVLASATKAVEPPRAMPFQA